MRVNTILFDMGGTLEDIRYSEDIGPDIAEKIAGILDIDPSLLCAEGECDFYHILQTQYGVYREFREKTMIEVHPAMVWKDWILKDFPIPVEKIFDHHEDLAYFWETEVIVRRCKEEVRDVLEELKKRNIRLGIISNTGSFTQVHKSIEKYGIKDFFEYVALSSSYGIRKPHGFLFRDVLNRMGCDAARTIYVGDTISRDVVGAKGAGLYGAIQIKSEFTGLSDKGHKNEMEPDYIIHNLLKITEIVDGLNQAV